MTETESNIELVARCIRIDDIEFVRMGDAKNIAAPSVQFIMSDGKIYIAYVEMVKRANPIVNQN